MKTAFVAALEREVKPLVRNWRVVEREYDGRRYKFFETECAVLVCGGIGADAARRATTTVISLYSPQRICSVGFAGALEPGLKVGDTFHPERVIDTGDGSSVIIPGGHGTLVSYAAIASPQQKGSLRQAYAAQAVDMEAAAVARGAQARDLEVAAFKVISDESDFEFPSLERFVSEGEFREASFIVYVVVRPWLWPKLLTLSRNSAKASSALCGWLAEYITPAESLDTKPAELHPMKRA